MVMFNWSVDQASPRLDVIGRMRSTLRREFLTQCVQCAIDVGFGVEDVGERRMPLNHCFSTILVTMLYLSCSLMRRA